MNNSPNKKWDELITTKCKCGRIVDVYIKKDIVVDRKCYYENNRKHKCEMCDETTNKTREDFADIGWTGFQIKNKKMKCYCPKHSNPKAISQMIKDGIIHGR